MQRKKDMVRIGAGSSSQIDRIDPAVELAEKGNVEYLVFDSMGEKTIVIETIQKMSNPSMGYDVNLGRRMRALLPVCFKNKVKIITNAGSVNIEGAVDHVVRLGREMGLRGLKVAGVFGDDVLDLVKELNPIVAETNQRVNEFGEKLIAGNAYVPSTGIIDALKEGADVVITGRIGDSSMYVGPLQFEFGWQDDDWDSLARAIIVGHLCECAGHVTGGYFADPPYKVVPNLHRLGYPIAEVYPNGDAVITKVPEAGGMVTPATCTNQLFYETHDPSSYIHAEVITDFSDIQFEQVGKDRVKVTGVKGKPRPDLLKVSLGVEEGYIGEDTLFYGGPGAYERAKLAAEIVKKRLEMMDLKAVDLRIDLVGINSLYGPSLETGVIPIEVGLRVAARTTEESEAAKISYEVEALPDNGPAACANKQIIVGIRKVAGYYHTFIPREKITFTLMMKEV